jgi:hypothetical protein
MEEIAGLPNVVCKCPDWSKCGLGELDALTTFDRAMSITSSSVSGGTGMFGSDWRSTLQRLEIGLGSGRFDAGCRR